MSTTLQRALDGDKVSEKAAPAALNQAVDKIHQLKTKLAEGKETVKAVGSEVIQLALTQGTLFLASFAEGALGDWMKPGGIVDVRPVIGGAAIVYGFYDLATGGDLGCYALAAGNGIVGSWTAGMGVSAGKAAADAWSGRGNTTMKDKAGNPPPSNVKRNADGQPLLDDKGNWVLAGPVRDVARTQDRRGPPRGQR